MSLIEFKKNVYSQNGEDGIIQEIINRLNLFEKNNLWCCEFGAWDGKHSSNTFALVEKYNFNAVYIESDKHKFKNLLKTAEKFPAIIPINLKVEKHKSNNNSLDNILSKTKITKYFEILSIDIDSYDLDVWESLENYNPKMVIIEINSSIPPGILQKHGFKTQGNSFSSALVTAKNNGYKLVCHTGNCIFIRKDLINLLKIDQKFFDNPELLFQKDWLYKKDSLFKKTLTKMIPNFLLPYLRIIKKILN